MNTHPYLRAYLAGVFVPTLILPLILTVFIVVGSCFRCPSPSSAASSFPWRLCLQSGACGTCFGCLARAHASRRRRARRHLALLLVPSGAIVARCLGVLAVRRQRRHWFNACSGALRPHRRRLLLRRRRLLPRLEVHRRLPQPRARHRVRIAGAPVRPCVHCIFGNGVSAFKRVSEPEH